MLNSKLSGDFIWYGNPFEGQAQSLLWFAVKKCFLCGSLTFDSIGTVNTKGLNSLPRIEGVDFSQNFLTAVMASAFRYPPANLSTVVLSHNSISYVEAGSFQHIYMLKSIDLSRNLLENVARSFFAAPARRLEHMDLRYVSCCSNVRAYKLSLQYALWWMFNYGHMVFKLNNRMIYFVVDINLRFL